MGKEVVETEGIIEECLPGTVFRVKLTDQAYQNHTILAHLSGKMRVHYIKILPGDRVTVEITPYDLNKGRITFRHKSQK